MKMWTSFLAVFETACLNTMSGHLQVIMKVKFVLSLYFITREKHSHNPHGCFLFYFDTKQLSKLLVVITVQVSLYLNQPQPNSHID